MSASGESPAADRKQAFRWNDGTEPCGGAMLSIVRLAGVVPGGAWT